ncbi:linear amide C-N hydrolase [Mesotoga sp. UBA5825]|uniref:linear amide C-N hydrolase n=1 Tax=Mesotoga sp. UBA5825 TaxID=1946858 RepID=UPI0025FF6D59|nr:linear amide C-N hydrolase [Mesotoga sp. UBA5825]
MFDLPAWILVNFDNLDSLKRALSELTMWGEVNELLQEVPPLHLSLQDSSGGSMVLEFTDGEVIVYENPNGVLTNSPELPWHLSNLRNYVNLSPYMKETEINGITYKGIGFGSGYVGIPGDVTPPSRFVRISFLREFSNSVETEEEGVMLALHLVNTVDIPAGVSKREESSTESFESTQWVTIKGNKNLKLYFRTYDCASLFVVDLNRVDFSYGIKHESIDFDKPFSAINVCDLFSF